MISNITYAIFRGGRLAMTEPLYQYDYGQILTFPDLDLPVSYEVHFSNSERGGNALTMIGGADGVLIPDELLLTGKYVYAFLFLHTDLEDGETEYQIVIPVQQRPQPTNQEPTPVQQDTITQAIAALNDAVERTDASASAAATSEANAKESEDNAAASASAAHEDREVTAAWALAAEDSAQRAKQSETNAAASATNANISAALAVQSADRAEQAATTAGYMFMEIDAEGHLSYTRTDQVDADFSLDSAGHLIVEAI